MSKNKNQNVAITDIDFEETKEEAQQSKQPDEYNVKVEDYYNPDNMDVDKDVDFTDPNLPNYEERGKLFPEGMSNCFIMECERETSKNSQARGYKFKFKSVENKREIFKTVYTVQQDGNTRNELGIVELKQICISAKVPINKPGFAPSYLIGLPIRIQVIHSKDIYLTMKMLIEKGIISKNEVDYKTSNGRKLISKYVQDNNLEYVKKAEISNYFVSNIPKEEYDKFVNSKKEQKNSNNIPDETDPF